MQLKTTLEHEREDLDRLAQQIAIEKRAHHLVMRQEAAQAEKAHEQKGKYEHGRNQKGQEQTQRKHVLHLVLLVPSHVFPAQDGGAADQDRADRGDEHVDRRIQTDGAHRLRADKVGGKIAGYDAVDRPDHRQHDLDRQQTEQQLREHLPIGCLIHFPASSVFYR